MSESANEILENTIEKLTDFNAQFEFYKGFYHYLISDSEAIGVEHNLVDFKKFQYFLHNQQIMFKSLAQESETLIDKLGDIESLQDEQLIVKGEK